ncbi:hypothetical protein AURANDRAFT_65333 [Aureococcus anophagefferens]|uniref:EF-hand domain-containing protein n=1 Tax=Aureococcus anophagefferens TaxID=44056 RepID=F0YDV7_AURAN|nr:hypothetical protein AURANDRAFT_65333 [Aureococcus anophagefferens]EGB06694.1 hypothetical protein AURANDRAFT_65333 [Aureococcus anophagefferens]|eukprot:XP_009038445.1 hypothetical protein AURANDRAFT_65333 [Aureococcus anophagefferens]
MGQKMGKGHVVEAAEPFLSLPQSAVDELWRSFNLNTEGWGLNPAQFTRMLGALTQTLQLDDDAARDLYGKLFEVFDTDKNDLIDALEFLATIAAISGMDANKKMMFVFNLYDFSENGELMLDEVTLLMKSTVVGLSKISLDTPPSLKEFEALAKLALGCELSVDGKPVLENTATISRTKFVTYCDSNPTMSSWLAHYDDVGAPPAETAEKPAIADVASLVLAADATNFKKRVDKKEWLATKDVGLGDAPCEAAHVQLIPTEPPASVSTKPDSTLELSWVFGFGAPGVRMNCHYCATGAVAFHAAEVCVLQSVGTEEEGFKPRQEFFLDHGLSISALALSADGATLASGDGGDEAKVCVWDAATRESKAVFRGFHRGAVTVLDFSKCGKLLLSVDARDHLALWDLAAKSKVASFVLGKKTYAACFTAHSLCFVSCGADHVTFWMASGQDKYNFAPKAGLPGAAGKKARTYTCVKGLDAPPGGSPADDALVATASGDGELLLWKGRNCFQTTEAHVGAIAALHFTSGGTKTALLTTAGVDGKVKIFRADTLDILCQMDLATLPAVGSPVAVCLHPLGEKCLVGTTDGELYELAALSTVPPVPEGEEGGPPPVGSALGGGPLVRGPSGSGGLVALVASPSGAFFATAGKDRAVTVFDAESKKTLFREVLQSAPTSVCFSADNTSLLVGLEKGTALVFAIGDDFLQVQTLDPNPAPEVEEGAEPAEPAEPDPDAPPPAAVIDCKWASDGTIALACDDKVHFFTSTDYVLKGTAQVSGVVSKMDFAEGAPLLQVGTVDLDLAIISSEDASSPAPDAAKDVAWQTATCPVAYGYKGVVSSLYFATPADAGVVAAAPALGLCAVGDQFGSVDLLPYPCLDKSGFQSSAGHGPGLCGVAFLTGETNGLLSGGASDGCVFQWVLDVDERVDEADAADAADAPPPDDDEEVVVDYKAEDDETLVDGIDLEIEDRSDKFKAVRGDVVAKLFELEDVDPEAEDAVDKFDATAPFKDTVVAPAAEPYLGPAVTNDDLVLDWVHGYAGQKMTSNVRYNVSGDVVYPAACVGIVLDKTKRSQRHMLRHTDVITATAMHPLGELCATAQVGDAPTVVVWNTLDGVVQRTFFLNAGSRACSALAFSADGKYLACAAQNDDHDVSVFDWDDGALARAGPTGGKKVLSMAFNAAGTKLVYGAVDSFGVASLVGRGVCVKRGIFGAAARRQTVPACGWITSGEGVEEAVIGTASGGVFKLDGRAIGSGEKMHSGPVTSIFTCPVLPGAEDGPETSAVALVTGGYDGKVKLLTPELEMKMEFDLGRPDYDAVVSSVASACLNVDRRKVLVGTKGSEIYELSTLDESDVNKGALVTGHCRGKLAAVAAHPILGELATVGDDMTLRTWDLAAKKQLRALKLEECSRALNFMPNGHLIGLGLGAEEAASSKTGVVLVVSTLKPSLEVVKELKDTTAAITCIKFSPDGEAMCAGAADMKIYVYDTLNNFVLKATCVGHTEPPRTLDFTENSASVMSCSSGPQFECVVHDAKSGDVQGDGLSEQANEPWDAWTSTIGWGVLGAYPAFSKTDDLTSCSRSFDKELLATSDDYGTVNLYRWPCVAPGAPAKTFVGHGPRVAMVRFTPKSDFLASAGETDRCLFQWSRKRNVGPEKASLDDEAAAALAASLAPVGLAPPPEAPEATWKDEVLPPSEDPTAVDAPARAPVLQFAYGVPTTKESVGYNAKGGVTYAAGRLVVAYDGKAHKQVFYEGCTKPISAFAVSADGAYCAAGEWDSVAPLKILDACTLVEVASLPPRLRGAMTRLAFSPCGKFVAAVGTGFGKAQTVCVELPPVVDDAEDA